MNFKIGAMCWHITGYINGDWLRPVLLCGNRPDPDYLYGGDAMDVAQSGMPVCKTCDRCTQGQASTLVASLNRPAE